jgi:hypothetical protein
MPKLGVSVSLDGTPIFLASMEQLTPEKLGLEQWSTIANGRTLVAWLDSTSGVRWRATDWLPDEGKQSWRRLYVGLA